MDYSAASSAIQKAARSEGLYPQGVRLRKGMPLGHLLVLRKAVKVERAAKDACLCSLLKAERGL